MMKTNKKQTFPPKKGRLSKEERKQVKEYRNKRKNKRDTLMALHE